MKGQMIESISVLKELLGRVPVVEDIQIADESEHGFTVILQERGSGSFEIHVTCLKRAVPSSVKEVVSQSNGQLYCIIMAPYISDASAKICETYGVGYCDLSGNCLIQMDSIYISNKGNPNRYPVENHAKTIFKSSAKITSLILRELMKDVSKRWKIKELAEKDVKQWADQYNTEVAMPQEIFKKLTRVIIVAISNLMNLILG